MASYFETLLLVSAATAVLSLLAPRGKSGKGVQLILSLALLSCLILPLGELSLDGLSVKGDLSYGKEEGEAVLEESLKRELENGIRAAVCERFSLKESEVGVSIRTDTVDNVILVRHLTLSLSGAASLCDLPSVVRYITDNTGAECEVVYK